MRRAQREKIDALLHTVDILLEAISITSDTMMDEDDDSEYLEEQLAKIVGMLCDLGDELEEKISHLHMQEDQQTGIDRDEAMEILRDAQKKLFLL